MIAVTVVPPMLTLALVGRGLRDQGRRVRSWEAEFRRSLRTWDGRVPVWVEAEARRRDRGY